MGIREIRAIWKQCSSTQLVRIVVIASLIFSCMGITALASSSSIALLSFQLFYIPLLYGVYAFSRRWEVVSGACALAFWVSGFVFSTSASGSSILLLVMQGFFLIVVGAVSAFIIRHVREDEVAYRALFEHSQLGIVMVDRDTFRVKRINQKFQDMLHHPAEHLIGSDFRSLFLTPRERERFLERLEAEKDTSGFETRFVTSEGDGCWVNMSWATLPGGTVSCTAIDITLRKIAEKAGNDTLAKYRQLTEHAPIGILITEDDTIRYANPASIAFLGYPYNEIGGRKLGSFIDPNNRGDYDTFTSAAHSRSGSLREGEFRFRTKDGERRVAGLFVTSILHQGRPAALVNIVDKSERDRLSERIEQDNIRRRGIVITVAHELRTPLQPILGYLNLLVQDPDGFGIQPETKKILERCLTSVDREREIIDKMLDLSVLESGKLLLSCSRIDIQPLIHDLLENSGYAAKATVTLDIAPGLTIVADRDRMQSVLDSILSNAVNFSRPPRAIRIAGWISDGRARISIQDNGIGIPEGSLISIFEPFQLADAQKLSRRFDRIGLSLSIAKKIVELHGGEITVDSVPNKGSTFTISIPVQPAPEPV